MPVIFTSAILGYCGVIYELVFAQSLSVLFGQSVVQYSVTIGLFLAGMGIGSHWAETWSEPRTRLWQIQLTLCGGAPLLLVIVWWLAVSGWPLSARTAAYFMCVSVGCVTGAELPLLLRLPVRTRGPEERVTWLLSADYFGMLAACLVFPLVLLPEIGVFATVLLTAILNAFVMVSLRRERLLASMTMPLLLIGALHFEPGLREWLSQKF